MSINSNETVIAKSGEQNNAKFSELFINKMSLVADYSSDSESSSEKQADATEAASGNIRCLFWLIPQYYNSHKSQIIGDV